MEKFTHAGIEFEPVESPEYIERCEKLEHGYVRGVNVETKQILRKMFKPERYLISSHCEEFFGEFKVRPYAETSADGTYRSELQRRNDFLNSLPSGIMIPKGLHRDPDTKPIPIPHMRYTKDNDD